MAIGQYDTDGRYQPYTRPVEVSQLGNTLRDKEDGFVIAVKDQYGDWVSPSLLRLGIKSKIKIEL